MTKKQKILLDTLDNNGWDVFSHKMLLNEGSMNNYEIWEALRFLTKNKSIIRIEKGKYYRNNFFNESVIACFIAENSSIAYWSALNNHGLTEQFPNIIFIQNTQRSGKFKIPNSGTIIKFVKVKPDKIFGIKTYGYGNHKWQMTDIEKTIVDSFDMPQNSGSFFEIIKAFNNAKLNTNKLIRYCKKNNNHSATRRLGFYSEFLNKRSLDKFIDYALSTVNNSYILLENGIPKTDKTNKKWKIFVNLEKEEIIEIANS